MVVVMGVLGVAGSEGELAEEDVRLRERVFVQFGTSGKVPYFLTQVTDADAVNGASVLFRKL